MSDFNPASRRASFVKWSRRNAPKIIRGWVVAIVSSAWMILFANYVHEHYSESAGNVIGVMAGLVFMVCFLAVTAYAWVVIFKEGPEVCEDAVRAAERRFGDQSGDAVDEPAGKEDRHYLWGFSLIGLLSLLFGFLLTVLALGNVLEASRATDSIPRQWAEKLGKPQSYFDPIVRRPISEPFIPNWYSAIMLITGVGLFVVSFRCKDEIES